MFRAHFCSMKRYGCSDMTEPEPSSASAAPGLLPEDEFTHSDQRVWRRLHPSVARCWTSIRDLEARIAALAERLEVELEGVDVFSPLEEREDCPVCFVKLPLAEDDLDFMACCGKVVCRACSFLQNVHELQKLATIDDKKRFQFICAYLAASRLFYSDAYSIQLRPGIRSIYGRIC